MKKLLLSLLFLFFSSFLFAQVSPTLAVGLEKLTMNKGTIDVEVLTEIIMSKQKELKQEALKRFMFKLFPEANFTTKYYVQNCLNVLLNEKNPQVIEKEILELTTNYALSLGTTYAIIKAKEKQLIKVDEYYKAYKIHSPYYQDIIIKEKEKYFQKKDRRTELTDSISKYDSIVSSKLTTLEKVKNISPNDFKLLVSNKKELETFRKKLARLKLRKDIINKANTKDDTLKIPFGIVLDVVSASLSNIPELQKKGFFKNKIDYSISDFYLNLESKNEGKEFKKSLDTLKRYVCEKITPYVKNYEIINEFLKKNKNDSVPNIIKNLRKEAANLVTPLIKSIKTQKHGPEIEKKLDEITKFENDLKYLTIDKIKNIQKEQLLLNPLDCNNCSKKIITFYKNSFNTKSKIEAINLATSQDFKMQVDSILSLIKSLQNNVNIGQLKLKTTSNQVSPNDSIISKGINDSIEKINSKLFKQNKNNKSSTNTEILNNILDLDNMINSLPQNRVGDKNIEIDKFIENEFLEINSKKLNEKVNIIDTLIIKLDKKIKRKISDTKRNETIIQNNINEVFESIANLDEFYNEYLSSVLTKLESIPFDITNVDSITISKASKIFPDIHSKVKSLISNHDIRISDIAYLDDHITERMIELKIRDKVNDAIYDSIIKQTKIIIPLLKIRALKNIEGVVNYNEELMNLFEFISNLNNLDKAETYQSIVNMLRDGSKTVQDNLADGEFKDGYTLFINAMKKYTLINPSEEYVEIDVVSFLTDLQQYYDRNNKSSFSLYLSLGLNQNFFFKNFKISEEESINNISFASEKIGVKWRIASFKRFEGYENVIKDDVYLNKKAPFINEFYGIVYGAGLLYTLANTTTNENFDFPHVGAGLGMRFYNALDVNLIIGFPFVKDANFGDNAFWGIGLDIPLGEYLEKLGTKNK
ncbi:hypothetical protein [Flavobacterium sp. LC2016-12]|uniref:hypothetical protein n=1 Tax=Flavobacterium sp. LC2016-12 TaxID=2783794 RepID=UPI00188A738C|nr:hypothetical protein [Flavobacterium sp. LC2016-12]MBF4466888.1 hypothetical protein [Flavobacterium sp. LC2016-12]